MKLSDGAMGMAALPAMGGSKFVLSYKMVKSRPSDGAQAALDELVEKAVIGRHPLPGGGVAYKALIDCRKYRRYASRAKFEMAVPIKPHPDSTEKTDG